METWELAAIKSMQMETLYKIMETGSSYTADQHFLREKLVWKI